MTPPTPTDLVTGAFSYSGSAIAAELHRRGRTVRTLTGHPATDAGSGRAIEVWPLDFSETSLRACLTGVDTLYNTYWTRFPQTGTSFDVAIANSHRLFAAAHRAGVRRVVHVSITNPAVDSPFPYFRGKAHVEHELITSGVPYAIARPAFLFGRDGVLINNVAWMFRHLPVVPVGDGGGYMVRGVHVDDLARLCVDLARGPEGACVDAVGRDRMSFRELLHTVRDAVAPHRPMIDVPGWLLTTGAKLLAPILQDQLLTRDEYRAMAAGLADSQAPTTGETSFRTWVGQEVPKLGLRYLNDTRGRVPPHLRSNGPEALRHLLLRHRVADSAQGDSETGRTTLPR
jgi:NADH dehydrogenase